MSVKKSQTNNHIQRFNKTAHCSFFIYLWYYWCLLRWKRSLIRMLKATRGSSLETKFENYLDISYREIQQQAKLHVRHNGESACRWHLLHSYHLNSIITILYHNLMQYNRHPYSSKQDQDVKTCPISIQSKTMALYVVRNKGTCEFIPSISGRAETW